MTDIEARIDALHRMTTSELAEYYEELYEQPCRTRHKDYLIRKIAWRIQANAEGGLSERARKRAMELADDADIRVMAPRTMVIPPQRGQAATFTRAVPETTSPTHDPRLPHPGPGALIVRQYKGKTHRVMVLENGQGFEYDGQRYASLSAVAKTIQQQLKHNGRTGGAEVRNKYGALLRGLLRCRCCDSAMTHTFTSNNRQRMYRYYRCNRTIQFGQATCSTGNLPASEIEHMVVDEIRGLARDESLLKQVLEEAQAAITAELEELRQTQDDLVQQRKRHHGELQKLASQRLPCADATNRMAVLHEQLLDIDQRLPDVTDRIAELKTQAISNEEARAVFGRFDDLWNNLIPREQARLLNLLIERVEYDGKLGTVSVTFRPTSIRTLINHQLEHAA